MSNSVYSIVGLRFFVELHKGYWLRSITGILPNGKLDIWQVMPNRNGRIYLNQMK